MKKIFVIGLLLCALFPSTFAQSPPANNWIDFSKTYYRYYSDETGLHRLDYNTLVAAGLNNLVGSQLQVFSRGEEIPIYVSTSGTFGPTDYVEFYGRKNEVLQSLGLQISKKVRDTLVCKSPLLFHLGTFLTQGINI